MKNQMMKRTDRKNDGYALLRAGRVSGEIIRTYWTGSPWRAFRECMRGQ